MNTARGLKAVQLQRAADQMAESGLLKQPLNVSPLISR
jgi:hypothetical protein